MARPLRLEFAGALYHITARGNRRAWIYETEKDRTTFLSLLSEVCQDFNWVCHAFCLMGNHYHLLIETPEGNLSQGMRMLNGVYTQRFNRRHRRVGHVFQGRYKAILVEKKSYLLELVRYILLNPVRAEMVRSARDWPWSSYCATVGEAAIFNGLTVDWILSEFHSDKAQAISAFEAFVAQGTNQPSPWRALKNQIYLGSDSFVERVQANIECSGDLTEIPIRQRRPLAKPLKIYETDADNRNEAIVKAYASGGYTLKEIASHFGVHYSTVSRVVRGAKCKT